MDFIIFAFILLNHYLGYLNNLHIFVYIEMAIEVYIFIYTFMYGLHGTHYYIDYIVYNHMWLLSIVYVKFVYILLIYVYRKR